MLPTVRRISGRSTSSSTSLSSSRIATRVSRWLPAIRISLFNVAHLGPRETTGRRIVSVGQGCGELVNLNERPTTRFQTERRSEYFRRLHRAVATGGHREAHSV